MRTPSKIIFTAMIVLAILSACGKQPVATPALTATPDPCAPANIVNEVKKVNDLQRQFDDASQLASVTPFTQLPGVIPPLQDVRRQAQDQTVPACLVTLKSLQIQQMNAVINTFLAFLAGGSTNPNTQVLSQGIAQARGLHGLYNQELARLIGATFVPPATVTPGGPAETPAATLAGTPAATQAGTPSGAFATGAGTVAVNIRVKPAQDAKNLVWMDPGKSIAAVGKTSDGLWIEVSDPFNNIGWVLASDVKLTNGDALPVVTPAP